MRVTVPHCPGWGVTFFEFVLELVESGEIVRPDWLRAAAAFDAGVAVALPGGLVTVVVSRSANVAVAFCGD